MSISKKLGKVRGQWLVYLSLKSFAPSTPLFMYKVVENCFYIFWPVLSPFLQPLYIVVNKQSLRHGEDSSYESCAAGGVS